MVHSIARPLVGGGAIVVALLGCWTSTSEDVARPGADEATIPVPGADAAAICAIDACVGDAAADGSAPADGAVVDAACVSDVDCADGEKCGYPILEACSASGACVTPDPPPRVDGAPPVACGCDGKNIDFITATTTAAPIASLTPCPEAGVGDAAANPDAAVPLDAGPSEASSDAQPD